MADTAAEEIREFRVAIPAYIYVSLRCTRGDLDGAVAEFIDETMLDDGWDTFIPQRESEGLPPGADHVCVYAQIPEAGEFSIEDEMSLSDETLESLNVEEG
ncbi:MAG TPA: hypothetical protein VFL91_21255 [Thermomicrobiales bacterium]|nr:hypothetical protein [Thermomicrobiales bacterium]